MSQKAFLIGESESWLRRGIDRIDWFWLSGLSIVALILFTLDLGALPLRDWDEGIVAQVAREIWRNPATWLHPQLDGAPYLNKPLLLHWLIALTYSVGGINEWASRLPGALLTGFSVPLLYCIGREIFYHRSPAIFAALVYLTFLPVVRHGRLAMLDGAILCFLLLMLLCVLRSRRDHRYTLGIGIGLGLICLTKGVMLGVLAGTIAIVFLAWDTPRLLTMSYLWLGILIGSFPVAWWYSAQWVEYGWKFLGSNVGEQSLNRIWTSVEGNAGAPWYYLLEVLKYGSPWLIFLPMGFRHVWENRNWGWAKLAIAWSGIYFVAISLMATKLPWYVLPLYPAFALVVGYQLAEMWHQGKKIGIRQEKFAPYSPLWIGAFAVLAILSAAGFVYLRWISPSPYPAVQVILTAVAVTMTITAVLLGQNDPQFIAVLLWGTFLSLLFLLLSPHWIWELAESYPVKPVAALLQANTPAGEKVYTSYENRRPSLNFYSDRQVIPANLDRLRESLGKSRQLFLLLDAGTLERPEFQSVKVIGSIKGWTLVTRDAE